MVERQADARIRTTEWEDIQYKHGNRVGQYVEGELKILAQRVADNNPNVSLVAYDRQEERVRDKLERGGYDVEEGTTMEELAVANGNEDGEGADGFDDDDDALLAFRRKRMAEMAKQQESSVFGVVRHIPGDEYVQQITEASVTHKVVAILMKHGHEGCDSLLNVMRQVASRNRDVKFVSMIAVEAMPKFPDKQLPCVLLYHQKELVEQVTTMEPWGGKNLALSTVEKRLARVGFLRAELLSESDDEDEEGNFRDGRIKRISHGL